MTFTNVTKPPRVDLDDPPPRFHADHCRVCSAKPGNTDGYVTAVAQAVLAETSEDEGVITALWEDPPLTAGQRRVFDAEAPRLVRLLDRRTEPATSAVLELLRDIAEQAPEVDAAIAEEADARPRPANLLSKRGES